MKQTLRSITTAGLSAAIGLFLTGGVFADADPANYVGVKTCGICHKKDEKGNQLAKWQASPHAKAFEVLGTPEAKEVGKKAGVDNPQTSGKCLKCHSTAYHFTETVATEKIKPEDGVTCESCHGPGKNYMKKATMENRDLAVAAGLIYPATKQCTLCHNDQSPTFKGFDVEKEAAEIAHPDPTLKK